VTSNGEKLDFGGKGKNPTTHGQEKGRNNKLATGGVTDDTAEEKKSTASHIGEKKT